jgi:hypothetical protein
VRANETCTISGTLEGFGGEAGDLPLHFAGGGSVLCVRGRRAEAFPDVHADAGEFLGLPSADVLRALESFLYSVGGVADAGGRDSVAAAVETPFGNPHRCIRGGDRE